MAFVEVLDGYFADFGEAVVLDGATVTAIFDSQAESADTGLAGVIVRRPELTLKTSDVPASPVGKTVVIGGVTYTIAEHLPDGTGISTAVLERA